MWEFVVGLILGATIGMVLMGYFLTRIHEADDYGRALEAMKKMQGPHDWQKDGSDL